MRVSCCVPGKPSNGTTVHAYPISIACVPSRFSSMLRCRSRVPKNSKKTTGLTFPLLCQDQLDTPCSAPSPELYSSFVEDDSSVSPFNLLVLSAFASVVLASSPLQKKTIKKTHCIRLIENADTRVLSPSCAMYHLRLAFVSTPSPSLRAPVLGRIDLIAYKVVFPRLGLGVRMHCKVCDLFGLHRQNLACR